MKKLLFLTIVYSICMSAASQEIIPDSTMKFKSRIFETTIYSYTSKIKRKYLVAIEDSFITVSSKPSAFNKTPGKKNKVTHINLADIKTIDIIKSDNVAIGAMLGLLIGGGIGAIAGLSNRNDGLFSPGNLAALNGLMFGAAGCLVGIVIGLGSKKRYKINGNSENLESLNETMLERIYIKPPPKKQ